MPQTRPTVAEAAVVSCSRCGGKEFLVVNSRLTGFAAPFRQRRYSCKGCDKRFNTVEYIEGEENLSVPYEVRSRFRKELEYATQDYRNKITEILDQMEGLTINVKS